MEKSSSHSLSLISLLGFFLFHGIIYWFIQISYTKFEKLRINAQRFLQYQLHFNLNKPRAHPSKEIQNSELYNEIEGDVKLLNRDFEIVVKNLGMFNSQYSVVDGNELNDRLGSEDFTNLFEEDEPSLMEVKEAFDVFDQNRDGFICARELQSVLCNLGFRDRYGVMDCEKMIKVFSQNGDGRIGFSEFVKFMEKWF